MHVLYIRFVEKDQDRKKSECRDDEKQQPPHRSRSNDQLYGTHRGG